MTKRMVRSALATVCAVVVALAVSAVAHVGVAHAATSAVYTAATVPSYSNPVTGSIEDSAGQSNIALAESMTTGCTYPAALVETDTAGNTFVTLRFKLADQMGAMAFWADNAGDGAFAEVEATQMQTSAVGDTAVADWRFQVPSETSNIRVSMYVNPMSRAVVYFVQLADLAEGNTDALPFVESVVPGEEAVEPTPATQAETAPAADAAASATSEAAPSTDSGANSGVKEYNADGQETTEGSQSAPLDGATTGAVVAGIVAVVVIAGVAAYFAYLKPKRAKQAAAAAAAAAAAKPKGK